MKDSIVRIAIFVAEAFIALTAIISGMMALIGGPGALQLSPEWLRNTPFSDYTIPMLLLVIVVGGSSLIAAATLFIHREFAVLLSMAAGLIMVGYEVVEVALTRLGMWLQELYFVLGLLIFALAAYLWMTEYRSQHVQNRHTSHA